MNELTSLLTKALNIHLNIGQNYVTNTSASFMSLETLSLQSISNKEVQLIGSARIRIPSNVLSTTQANGTSSLRVCFCCLSTSAYFSSIHIYLVNVGTIS